MAHELRVVTSDGEQVYLSHEVTTTSSLLTLLTVGEEFGEMGFSIDLPIISAATLAKIVQFCEHDRGQHFLHVSCNCHVTQWHMDAIFVDEDTIWHLQKAADYLDMRCLLKLGQNALLAKLDESFVNGPTDVFKTGCRPKMAHKRSSADKENQPTAKRPRINSQ